MADEVTAVVERRRTWSERLQEWTFEQGVSLIPELLAAEVAADDSALRHHLMSAAVIPESFGHDSTAEKLFAKYTDHVISLAFRAVGCESAVTTQRADAADVEGTVPDDTTFVADAKAFRLSRTAKNQKDFKVEALAGWRGNAAYAVLVAPLFQYPSSQSQIYEQATRRGVCILGYAHLRALIEMPPEDRVVAFRRILDAPAARPAEKSASTYWGAIHRALTEDGANVEAWERAYAAEVEGLEAIRNEELAFLTAEVERINAMTHDELAELLAEKMNLPNRLEMVRGVMAAQTPAI